MSDNADDRAEQPSDDSHRGPVWARSKSDAQIRDDNHWFNPILTAAIIGLAVWAVWSVGSCTVSSVSRGMKAAGDDYAQFSREYDARQAEKRAAASEAPPSDVVIISAAKMAVKRKLVDDGSVRFRQVTIETQTTGAKVVCGQVNSRNRAGGYAGFQHFVSNGGDELTILEEERSDFSEIWNSLCVP